MHHIQRMILHKRQIIYRAILYLTMQMENITEEETQVQSTKELNQTIVFDYSQWVMISQPKTRNFWI